MWFPSLGAAMVPGGVAHGECIANRSKFLSSGAASSVSMSRQFRTFDTHHLPRDPQAVLAGATSIRAKSRQQALAGAPSRRTQLLVDADQWPTSKQEDELSFYKHVTLSDD